MQKITIGYYDDTRSGGGTIRYLHELIGALNRNRFHPVLFAEQAQEWHKDLAQMGVEMVLLNETAAQPAPSAAASAAAAPASVGSARKRLPSGLFWFLGLVKDTRRLVRLFRKRPVHILHSNNTGAEPAPLAARLAGIPHIIGTWHVDSTYDLTGKRSGLRYRLLEWASMRALHHAIAVSEATKQDWVKRCHLDAKYQNRVHVIYNGIGLERTERKSTQKEAKQALGFDSGSLLVGSLGRLAPEKGYEYLIKAIPEMRRWEPRLHFVIAGAGPLEASLRQLAADLNVASFIRFHGFVSDVGSFLEALDIYVQPSLCEALPFGILEASGLGLPVVVSDVGGAAEAALHNQTGLVIPAKSVEAITEAVVSLSRNSALRQTMGQQGRSHVISNFDRQSMARDTMAIYETMIGKRMELSA